MPMSSDMMTLLPQAARSSATEALPADRQGGREPASVGAVATDATRPSADERAHLEKSVRDFEAYMLGHVFQTAYESIPQNEFSGGMAEGMYQSMFMQEAMKQGTNSGRGLGLADMMLRQFDRTHKVAGAQLEDDLQRSRSTVGFPMDSVYGQTSYGASGEALIPPVATATAEAAVTSGFGHRHDPVTGRVRMHSGIDLRAEAGSPIRAAAMGKVVFSGARGGYGNAIVVEHGRGLQTMYAHNAYNVVRSGEQVRRGQVIGFVGSTGRSTGPHVHFEVREGGRAVNPQKYFGFMEKV